MSDRHLQQSRQIFGHVIEVVKVKVMSGIHSQSYIYCCLGGVYIGLQGLFGVLMELLGIGFGVEFYAIGACGFCRRDEFGVGVEENRYSGAGFFNACNDLHKVFLVCDGIPTGVGGNGIWWIWYQGNLVGFYRFDEL